ncbi:General secretion pathway protein E [Candidatus Rhodobacter oscarellae]|uniref:General secretion pathway protein E n=1 Tax=Candidatus Rhodobacter oscarellae TaxID=1675527 RepID=A0A0J9ECJ1_9RHOB|nr:GspE/PulE family protein [Candidatus Rhodobacter lobularis]KMW59434.1 General secretion pathway protein E [Candidatus Rhodobacter lobularis]
MAKPDLPFTFARDQQMVLRGDALVCGPGATVLGMREARRRAGIALTVERLEAEAFEALLNSHYREGTQAGDEDDLTFDLEAGGGPAVRDLLEDATEAPVIELVNQLMRRTVRGGASDLHVEPYEDGLRARVRVDGMLRTVMDRSDVPVRRVVSRLKVMAGMDTAETRLPQDGRIGLRYGGRDIDVRMSTLPGQFGERITLRVLDRHSGLMPLERLGLGEDQEATLARLAARPDGIVLATGPTGSGKTTTLYSLLQLSDHTKRNIVTVEDPIEYHLPGISQTQTNSEIGMSFAAGLRATLRQDPDVILVGEIRDGETAQVAAQASLTGHLVFSSLHANSSVAAVTRLRDLGLDNYLIAATLRGILAQRLLRQVCTHCAESAAPDQATAEMFAAHGLPVPLSVPSAVGCEDCADTGYQGRQGVYEIVEITEDVGAAIGENASEQALKRLAVPAGSTLIAQGLKLVAEGRTTIPELHRVLGAE